MHSGDHGYFALVDSGEGGEAAAVGPDERSVALGLDLLDVDTGTEPASFGPENHHSVLLDASGGDEGVS